MKDIKSGQNIDSRFQKKKIRKEERNGGEECKKRGSDSNMGKVRDLGFICGKSSKVFVYS